MTRADVILLIKCTRSRLRLVTDQIPLYNDTSAAWRAKVDEQAALRRLLRELEDKLKVVKDE
jgi:hypothetical protein